MQEFSKSNLKQWELDIINEYPEIFITEPAPYVQRLIERGYLDKDDWVNLRYGFEFDQGWAAIVKHYCYDVGVFLRLIRASGEFPGARVWGCIMKEKFGALTIQNDTNLPTEYFRIYSAICGRAENTSAHTCEITGKFGKLRTIGGYVKTLSDEEYNKIIKT